MLLAVVIVAVALLTGIILMRGAYGDDDGVRLPLHAAIFERRLLAAFVAVVLGVAVLAGVAFQALAVI